MLPLHLSREHIDALFVAPDGFFTSRRVQFAILAARNGIAAAYSNRTTVEAGGLMSYGTNIADMHRQVRGTMPRKVEPRAAAIKLRSANVVQRDNGFGYRPDLPKD